tara:strand:- start:392 stop:622 length:231 start_codon:yes stop_codon:yes gene_type:complete
MKFVFLVMWNKTPIEQLLVLLIFAASFIWFFYSEGFFNDIIDSAKGKDYYMKRLDDTKNQLHKVKLIYENSYLQSF